jgi:hypothetical protein
VKSSSDADLYGLLLHNIYLNLPHCRLRYSQSLGII